LFFKGPIIAGNVNLEEATFVNKIVISVDLSIFQNQPSYDPIFILVGEGKDCGISLATICYKAFEFTTLDYLQISNILNY
jgi:hypothetical protein